MSAFTVDTHLFRELGQLLVGRDSTALVELVKNSYDADAHDVIVHGEYLHDPNKGLIRIQDTGVGMTPEQFEKGFLRIASRLKEEGLRVSPRYGRRYTGAKGIGRLAAHKLARIVEIESVPYVLGSKRVTGINARIDWDRIESRETLDLVDKEAVRVNPHVSTSRPGTTIVLRRLRQKWTPSQLSGFLAEIDGFQAPVVLHGNLPRGLVNGPTLFDSVNVIQTGLHDPGFIVRLEGDFARGDDYWPALAQSAHWLLEIDATKESVRYGIYPLKKVRDEVAGAQARTYTEAHPDREAGPFFKARILVREGRGEGEEDARGWVKRTAGVRVFMEGFRVLPYGEPSDDWLEIERDTSDRDRRLHLTSNVDISFPPVGKEGLLLLPRKHYFGGVFLTQDMAPNLSMLVNREGFVPDPSFVHMRTIVRRGIDLLTRVRASLRAQVRDDATPLNKRERKIEVESAFAALEKGARELRTLATSLPAVDARKVESLVLEIEHASELQREYLSSEGMTRVLASVGLQLAAFTHEMNSVLGMAQAVEIAIIRIRDRPGLAAQARAELTKLLAGVGDLRRAIERQAAHLTDVVTPDARRRRSRQRLAERFNAARRFVDRVAEARNIEIRSDIGPEVRSPPMFVAELTTILTNLLTNAVKAAGDGGRVRASADEKQDGIVILRLENTGMVVEPSDGERWFRPFESTTSSPDPVLGQGMGLGLSITRDMLSEVGAAIAFVPPRKGFATAVQIIFPK